MKHALFEVSRSDRNGKVLLPSYYASEVSAREAAISSLSLDAASVLTSGGDGIVMMQSEGNLVRLMLASDPGTPPLVTYAIEIVDLDTAKGEEVDYSDPQFSLRRPYA